MNHRFQPLYRRQLLFRVLIFSFVTVAIWIAFTIFRSQSNTEIDPELLQLAQPLNPNLNTGVIERIKAKRVYSPDELANFVVYKKVEEKTSPTQVVITVVPSPLPAAVASPAAKISTGSAVVQ